MHKNCQYAILIQSYLNKVLNNLYMKFELLDFFICKKIYSAQALCKMRLKITFLSNFVAICIYAEFYSR